MFDAGLLKNTAHERMSHSGNPRKMIPKFISGLLFSSVSALLISTTAGAGGGVDTCATGAGAAGAGGRTGGGSC